MANEIYADQLLHIIYRGAIEAVATAVEDVYRLGVRATDLETLIGEVDASPTSNTIMDRLKSIITNTATIAADPATATLQTAGNASLTTIAGVDFATQTKQDTGNTSLSTIAAKDFATQATLADVLAKIIAAPATEAKQDTTITHLSSIAGEDFATQTTLAAVLSALQATLDVVIADGDDVALGATTDAAETDPAATASAIQLIKGILKQLQGTGTGNQNVYIADAGITLPTDKQGIYRSELFNTTVALGSAASYTSSAYDGITLKRITGTINADQSGALYFQHSKDGTNWNQTRTIAFVASTPQSFDEPFYSRYMRLIYTNGASAQGSFELVVYSSAD
jgi:hypothetical protein